MSKKHDSLTQAKYQKNYGGGNGFTVKVRQNADGSSDVNSALRVMKKRMQGESFFKEMREREYYVSRGEKRRRKRADAIRRSRKNQSQSEFE